MKKLSKRDDRFKRKKIPSNIATIDLSGAGYENPKEIAKLIICTINTFLHYIKPESRELFKTKILNKFNNFNLFDMNNKSMPATSRIGQSISIAKTLLNGQDVVFINEVMGIVLRHL